MSRKEGSEHRAGPGGSGTLSHVYIQHPPLRCGIPETHGLYYDDGNRLVLSPTSDQVLSWKTSTSVQPDPPDSDYIGEGLVMSIRYSLDKKLIAVQRSDHEIQFKNRDTSGTFFYKCKPETEKILGFFWTDCPSCDVVLVKTSGLDLLSYELGFNRFHLVESKRLNVSWYVYTHGSRMVLLASGMQCKLFSGFQFSSAGIVRLPKFEMKLAKAEANHKPVLSAEDVTIVTIYGRIYCLQADKVDMQLHVYRFYCDAVVHQGSLPIYSTRIAISVVDNVLLIHQVDAKVVILYDIFLESLLPVSAPLPLRLRGVRGFSSLQSATRLRIPVESDAFSAYDQMIYGDTWSFLVPDLICDMEHGLVWKILLDLEAIAASSSEVPYLLEFLQRRRSEPMKAKQLCLMMLRNMILERRPLPMFARALNVIVAAFSQEAKVQSTGQKDTGRFSSDGKGPSNYVGHEELPAKTEKDVLGDVESVDISSTSMNIKSPENLASNLGGISERKTTLKDSIANSSSGSVPSSSSAVKEITYESLDISMPSAELLGPSDLVSTTLDIRGSITSAVISPDDMYHYVLSIVEEEMAGDPAFLLAVIIEFLRSAALEKVAVPSNVYVMMIKLLTCDKRYSELSHFVLKKIIEPSKEVALQLLDAGQENVLARKLGLDMLSQLSLHTEYLQMLLQYGYYLEALTYVRKKKVAISQTSLFLDAAFSGNNHGHLAAVLRFFSDYIPSFQSTQDFHRYAHILNEIP